MHSLAVLLPLFSLALPLVQAVATCNVTTSCPTTAPCCSEFGFCGSTEAFCLGGCNPLYSNTLDSCKPNPVCKNAVHTFTDNSRILSNASFFDGNASAYDFIVESGNIMNTNSSGGELAMLLTQENGGTRISSTRYLHYGTVTARMKTGRWAGIVTAFITMSNVKDEIDWEFPGNTTTEGQSNYFWQGVVTQPNHGNVTTGLTDTFANYHDYTIDWQPETLQFLVDGKVVRTLKKSDTIVNGVAEYPSTPARIQLSLWPAGTASSAAGTVQWSGGLINYNDPDYVSAGHFYALVKSVNVTCADPTAPGADITAYTYGANSSTNTPSVALTNATTDLNGAPGLQGRAGTGLQLILALAVAAGALGQLL
ncbi:glycoside hydrolase family 16 protein [Mycena albidolilacea]|uniref:Glycoside hydrolase family 16 protein n=1 Tax=Mycena albidolilacea TaxID=1033008 RepID=A0AAD7F097_9AGAR|nr:glycoside hydrolase family 16 protein [Mycena albidolilacea]